MGKVALALATKKATVLENYFFSSHNSSDPGPLQIPSARKRPRPESSSEASTSGKDDECMVSTRANIAVQVICPGGLSMIPEVLVGVEIFDGVEIIDMTDDAKATGERQKRRAYEVSRKCQDHWAVQHPWAEMVRGDRDTIVHRVKCIICSSVKGKPVTMGPKSDTLEKHAGKRTATADLPHLAIKKDETYIFKDCRHLKAAASFSAKALHAPTVLDKVQCLSSLFCCLVCTSMLHCRTLYRCS
jgi:hypothetical protein